ncbi:MAG: Maf family protein [Firmicutes bacterium]|nr:Maf family protein [Bacillota bacterium]
MRTSELQNRFNNGEIIEFSKPTIVLASASPRRARLLENTRLEFEIIVSTVDDTALNNKFPHEGIDSGWAMEYAKKMALAKLKPFVGKIKNGAVITADTIIWCDGRILEKPLTIDKCREQHEFLSGKININYTAYAIYYNGKVLSSVMPTTVKVENIPLEIIEVICLEPEILDCAGYRNQGQINAYLNFNREEADNLTGLYIPKVIEMLKKVRFIQ